MSERDRIGEMQDRLRRMETRFVKLSEFLGYKTIVESCKLISVYGGKTGIKIPSRNVRLGEILETIASSQIASRETEIPIFIGGDWIGAIRTHG